VLKCFALFSLPIRVTLYQRLARQPSSAGGLARQLPVSRVAVVQHLKAMEAAGLVYGSRRGRYRVYRIDPTGLAPLAGWIAAHQQLGQSSWSALQEADPPLKKRRERGASGLSG
jgi:DNA-binding transcriptional ArsR family regulator